MQALPASWECRIPFAGCLLRALAPRPGKSECQRRFGMGHLLHRNAQALNDSLGPQLIGAPVFHPGTHVERYPLHALVQTKDYFMVLAEAFLEFILNADAFEDMRRCAIQPNFC